MTWNRSDIQPLLFPEGSVAQPLTASPYCRTLCFVSHCLSLFAVSTTAYSLTLATSLDDDHSNLSMKNTIRAPAEQRVSVERGARLCCPSPESIKGSVVSAPGKGV